MYITESIRHSQLDVVHYFNVLIIVIVDWSTTRICMRSFVSCSVLKVSDSIDMYLKLSYIYVCLSVSSDSLVLVQLHTNPKSDPKSDTVVLQVQYVSLTIFNCVTVNR